MSDADWDLLNGDCVREMFDFADEQFDAIITDPPYGIDYDSGWRRKVLPKLDKIQNDQRPFVWWLYQAYRVVKDGGHLLCFCRWDVQEAFRLAIEWAGFKIKGQVIWDRGLHGLGDLEGQFAPQHDVIWHATKGRAVLYGKRPKSVITIMRPHGESLRHQNEKPVPLMRYLVRAVTKPGDNVLDPHAGTGSTIKACLQEGRSCTGIELDGEIYRETLAELMKGYQPTMFLEDMPDDAEEEEEEEEEGLVELVEMEVEEA